eukprot:g1609.t1
MFECQVPSLDKGDVVVSLVGYRVSDDTEWVVGEAVLTIVTSPVIITVTHDDGAVGGDDIIFAYTTRGAELRAIVSGDVFDVDAQIFCLFGEDIAVRATAWEQNTVRCSAPQMHFSGSVEFKIRVSRSENPADSSSYDISGGLGPVMLSYVLPPVVQSIFPRTVSSNGGDVVTINGANFRRTDSLRVLFAASLHPSMGPTSGGTNIVVTGMNFKKVDHLHCLFGADYEESDEASRQLVASSRATVHEQGKLSCRVPPLNDPRMSSVLSHHRVRVTLTSRGNLMSGTGEAFSYHEVQPLFFQFREPVHVTAATPRHGPVDGGTVVAIDGRNFVNSRNLKCRFGRSVVSAEFVNSTKVLCHAPFHNTSALVVLRVSNNGVDYSASGPTYTYLRKPKLTSIRPSQGPMRGGITVYIHATDLQQRSDSIFCRFGTLLPVEASYRGPNVVSCVTPSLDRSETLSVQLTTNGQDYVGGFQKDLKFAFVSMPLLYEMLPSSGPTPGGTRVAVTGGNFEASNFTLMCSFGHVIVPSVVVSDTKLECVSPHSAAGSSEFRVVADDRTTQVASVNSLLFSHYAPESVESILPSFGPIMGGTSVTIRGNNFIRSENVRCRFGNASFGITTRAVVESASSLSCSSPAWFELSGTVITSDERVGVSVANNGVDFRSNGVQFTFTAVEEILSVYPSRGSQNGGTEITIRGRNFIDTDTSFCRFEHGSTRSIAKATYVTSDELKCVTPPMAASREIQRIHLHTSSVSEEVQEIHVAAATEVGPEVQIVRTSVRSSSSSVQRLSVRQRPQVPEIQRIRLNFSPFSDVFVLSARNFSSTAFFSVRLYYYNRMDRFGNEWTEQTSSENAKTATVSGLRMGQSSAFIEDRMSAAFVSEHVRPGGAESSPVVSVSIVDRTESVDGFRWTVRIVQDFDGSTAGVTAGPLAVTLESFNAGPTTDFDVQSAQIGSMPEIQRIWMPHNAQGETWFLTLGDEQTTHLSMDASRLDVKEAIESLESVLQVSVTRHDVAPQNLLSPRSYRWDVTFTQMRGSGSDIPLMNLVTVLGPDDVEAVVAMQRNFWVPLQRGVERSVRGNVPATSGYFRLSVGNMTSDMLPHDASSKRVAAEISRMFNIDEEDSPVHVVREVSAFGGYSWIVTFTKSTGPLRLIEVTEHSIEPFGFLHDDPEGPSVSVDRMQSVDVLCCATITNGFRLSAEGATTAQPILQLNSTARDIEQAATLILRELGAEENVHVSVQRRNLMNEGAEWLVTFSADLAYSIPILYVVDGSVLGESTTVDIEEVQTHTVAEVQRVDLLAATSNSRLVDEGHFKLSLMGETTDFIEFNASADSVADALRALNVTGDDVSVRKDMQRNADGGFAWIITFVSLVGDVEQLSGTTFDMTASPPRVGVEVGVTEIRKGTGEPVEGSFVLCDGNECTDAISALAEEDEMKRALEYLPSVSNVRVNRNYINSFNNEVEWFVTFLGSNGDVQELLWDSERSSLNGTLAEVSIIEARRGSILGGEYVVSFGGYTTDAIAFDSTAETVRRSLLIIPPLRALLREQPLLTGNDIFLEGSDARITISRTQRSCCDLVLTSNGADYSSSVDFFAYESVSTVTEVAPSSGPRTGGTTVRITGSIPFVEDRESSSYCIFGNSTEVLATIEDGRARCVTPPVISSVRLPVRVKQFSSSDASASISESLAYFNFDEVLIVESIRPSTGPTRGGTVVQVHGSKFSPSDRNMSCKFSASMPDGNLVDIFRVARFVSDHAVACETPQLAAFSDGDFDLASSVYLTDDPNARSLSVISVTVSKNGVDFSSQSRRFRYYGEVSINSVEPSKGIIHGGTVVTIRGSNFERSSDARCDFGGVKVPIHGWVSSTVLLCRSPGPILSQSVQVFEVSSHGPTSSTVASEITSVTSEIQGFAFRRRRQEIQRVSIISSTPIPEVQRYSLSFDGVLRGFFAITTLDGEHSSSVLRADASAEEFVAALRGMYHSGGISSYAENATLDITADWDEWHDMLRSYTVEFRIGDGDLNQLILSNVSLVSSSSRVTEYDSETLQDGTSSLGGILKFRRGEFDGDASLSTYASLRVRSSEAEARRQLLDSLANVGVVDVSVNRSDGVAQIFDFYLDADIGDALPFDVNISDVKGADLFVEVDELQSGDADIGGSFRICLSSDFDDDDQCTDDIQTNATEFTFQSYIVRLLESKGIIHSIDEPGVVLRRVENTRAALEWQIEFPIAAGNVMQLHVDGSNLNREPESASCYTIRNGTYETLHGIWSVRAVDDDNSSSVRLFANASAEDVKIGIIAVLGLNDEDRLGLNVSRLPIDDFDREGFRWRVEFPTWRQISLVAEADDVEGNDVRVFVTSEGGGGLLDRGVDASIINITVWNNGIDSSQTFAAFQFHRPISLFSLHPDRGSVLGGTVVVVRLRPPVEDGVESFAFDVTRDSVVCRFGDYVVGADIVDEMSVRCITMSHRSGIVPVSLSLNGQDFVDGGLTYTFEPVVQILSLSPVSGPTTGNTMVEISGHTFARDFLRGSQIQCRFGSTVVNASLTDDTTVRCRSPPRSIPGTVAVEVTNNAQDFTSQKMQYEYVPPLFVTSVEPSIGPAQGGSEVIVRGGVFRNTSSLQCRFADVVVDASRITNTSLRCITPHAEPLREVQEIILRARAEVQVIRMERGAIGTTLSGTWTIGVGANRCTSVPLTFNASKESVARAVSCIGEQQNTTLFGTVHVLRQETILGTTWQVHFSDRRGYGVMPLLEVDNGIVASAGGVSFGVQRLFPGTRNEIQIVRISSTAQISGSFVLATSSTLGANASRLITTPIPANASASEFAQHLSSLASEIGSVFVERREVDPDVAAFEWSVLFTSRKGNVPPLLVADDSTMSSDAVVSVIEMNGTSSAFNDSFVLEFNGLGSECEWDGHCTTDVLTTEASAADVQAALATLPSIGDVTAERSVNSAMSEVVWTISFIPSTLISNDDVRIGSSSIPLIRLTSLSSEGHNEIDYEMVLDANIFMNDVPCTHTGHSSLFLSQNETVVDCELICDACLSCAAFVHYRLDDRCVFKSSSAFVTMMDSQIDTYLKYTSASSEEFVVERTRAGVAIVDGPVPIEVSSNGHDFTSSGILFEYLPVTFVDRLSPNHGPLRGNTQVDVFGANFRNSTRTFCRFGSDAASVVPMSTFLSTNHIQCMSPARFAPGSVEVMISNDGFSSLSKWSNGGAHFKYNEIIPEFRFFPSMGPTIGGVRVRVTGEKFVNSTWGPICRFGSTTVSALLLSDSELLCTTPEHPPGYFAFELSNNNQDFTAFKMPYHFYENMVMERIEPVSGPARYAGTAVHVYGRNFINSTQLMCRFGPQLVPGQFVASNEIICSTPSSAYNLTWKDLSTQANRDPNPAHMRANVSVGRIGWSGGSEKLFPGAYHYPLYLSKLVSVEVSNNAQDFTDSGIRFLYQKDAEIHSITPTHGLDTARTPIFVRGTGFVNSTTLKCRVGQHVSKAQFITSDLLLCFAPPRSPTEPMHGVNRGRGRRRVNMMHLDAATTNVNGPESVFVEVSNNGVDFTSNWKIFDGVGFPDVVPGSALHAQNCTEGFYCELASVSPKGSGLCPPGFYCPEGTAVPVPTAKGYFAEIAGTVQPAKCLPGTYAPTIETVRCYPCPPGEECSNDGLADAKVCQPGTYRSMKEDEGIMCTGCPQGTWSKQWEVQDVTECIPCPPGVVCPIDGMTRPCSRSDLPTPWTPTENGESVYECKTKGEQYEYGYLDPRRPWAVDSRGRGPYLVPSAEIGECFVNNLPNGTVLYQRMRDYYGSRYDLQNGYPHQGYGDSTYRGYYGAGSLAIALSYSNVFKAARNCTPGFMLWDDANQVDKWYPGECEADLICNEDGKSQAEACSEGYVCFERTTASSALSYLCPPGFVCDYGTTPDTDLESPSGMLSILCPEGYFCPEGTGRGQMFRNQCPEGFFCPTGTGNPYDGTMARDSILRSISRDDANPRMHGDLQDPSMMFLHLPSVTLPRYYSEHDRRCFDGIHSEWSEITIVNSCADSVGVCDNYDVTDDPNAMLTIANLTVGDAVPEGAYKTSRFDVDTQSTTYEYYKAGSYVSSMNRNESTGAILSATVRSIPLTMQHEFYIDSSEIYNQPNEGLAKRNLAVQANLRCGRDHSWRYMQMAIERGECDCVKYSSILLDLFEFWKCRGDDVGVVASRCRLSAESFPCWLGPRDDVMSLDGIPSHEFPPCVVGTPEQGAAFAGNHSRKIRLRHSWTFASEATTFTDIADRVKTEYKKELAERQYLNVRERFDPYIFDLYHAVQTILQIREDVPRDIKLLVEQDSAFFGNASVQQISLSEGDPIDYQHAVRTHGSAVPYRYDRCACEQSMKCPNGTVSDARQGSIYECVKSGSEVLLRKNMIPTNATWKSWDLSMEISENRTEHIQLDEYSNVPASHVGLPVWSGNPKLVKKYNFDGTLYDAYIVQSVLSPQISPNGDILHDSDEEYLDITGDGSELRSLELKGWEVAVVTMDFRDIPSNFTYDKHYRVGVYVDCMPCPTRYRCDNLHDPPKCSFPPFSRQLELGVFCEDSIADSGELIPGCCQCEPEPMPHFFESEPSACDPTVGPSRCIPYEDNKHGILQFSISALRDVKITIAMELLHGLHYESFRETKMDVFDVKLFMPNRTSSSTDEFLARRARGEYSSFLAVLLEDDFDDLDMNLPMNLPMVKKRLKRTIDTFVPTFAHDVLIDRIANISLGDRDYAVRQQDLRYVAETYGPNVSASWDLSDRWTPVDMRSLPHGVLTNVYHNANGERVGEEFEIRHNLNYMVRDPEIELKMESTWWQTSETSSDTGYDYSFDFIGLHYLPFFSNCEGYGSHMSIAKMLEDNYICNYAASTALTRPVEEFGVFDTNAPFGDTCISKLEDPFAFDTDNIMGIEMQCMYEENVYKVQDAYQWFEMAGGSDDETTLFHMTKYPVMFNDFKGEQNEECMSEKVPWPKACNSAQDPWRVRWGRTFHDNNDAEKDKLVGNDGGVGLSKRVLENTLVPVTTSSAVALKSTRRVPRRIRFELHYFQVTHELRSLVTGKITFDDPCTTFQALSRLQDEATQNFPPICPCRRTEKIDEYVKADTFPAACAEMYAQLPAIEEATELDDFGYKFELVYVPLKWLDLLNLFEFSALVYIVFFVIIGGATVMFGVLIYLLTWVTSRVRNPPPFRFAKLFVVVAPSPLIGVVLGTIPTAIGCAIIYFWFVHSASQTDDDMLHDPSTFSMENMYGNFLETSMTIENIETHRIGRIGTCMIVMGFYMIHLGSKIFVPDNFDELADDDIRVEDTKRDEETMGDESDDEEKVVQSLFWRPMFWKRANLILMSCAT